MNILPIATRRDFLIRGLGLIGVGTTLPRFLVQTALSGPPAESGQSVLVVLQLTGGNDGLSTVIPYADDQYHRSRRGTRLTADQVLRIDDRIGLHPNLTGFRDLMDEGSLSIVQGVGYPNPNRSHFQSMDIWHAAHLTEPRRHYGWLGRYAEHGSPGQPDPALMLAIGSSQVPLAMQGRDYAGLSVQRPETFRFLGEQALGEQYQSLLQSDEPGPQGVSSNLDYVVRTTLAANATSERILAIASRHRSPVAYPTSSLAASLRVVAALIAGNLNTRVYYVFQGGYDTHAGQRQRHDRLMRDLNDAVVAFQRDLVHQGNDSRVLTMAFSEFGRRVQENGSQGTDHGAAAPMFLVGSGVRSGVLGEHPSLSPRDLDRGDLRHSVDFRSVYATALEKWLGTPSQAILGGDYPLVNGLA